MADILTIIRYRPTYRCTLCCCGQWDLVCDKNYLMETSQSVFSFGVMVGAIIFTAMADRLGRKPIHLGCQYSMLVVGVVIAFAPNYVSFVVLRFFLGALREVSLYYLMTYILPGAVAVT